MRGFFAIVLPLALPTAAYLLYMSLVRRRPGAANSPAQPIEIPWSWLIVAGSVLAVVTLVAVYVFEDAGRGTYHPAQTIDGKIKPGYFDNTSN